MENNGGEIILGIMIGVVLGVLLMGMAGGFRSVHLSQGAADNVCQQLTNKSNVKAYGYINSNVDEYVSRGGMVCRIGKELTINSNLRIVNNE